MEFTARRIFALRLTMADNVLKYKYVVKNAAVKRMKIMTFMPKPLCRDNSSGMHVHISVLKGDEFTTDVIETWIDYKMKNEVLALDLRPHPWEFMLYFDI